MGKPSVNVVLRLDSSKVKDDAEKAKSILTTSIGPTVDVFNVATKAVELFGKSLEIAGKGLVFLTERTGAAQSLASALDDTRKAIGEAADRSGALRTAMGAIETAAKDLATYMRSPEGREAINAFFGAISSGAAAALDTLNGLSKVSTALARAFLEGAPKGSRAEAMLKSLAPVNDQGETRIQAIITETADQLRKGGAGGAGAGVLDRGTYVDEDAKKTRKAARDASARADADLERNIDAALGRAKEQAEKEKRIAMFSLDEQRKVAELQKTIEDNVLAYQTENAARRAELREKEIARQSALDMDALRGAEANASLLTDLAAQATGGIANAITSGAAAIASNGDLGAAVAAAMGGAIASLGATLIAAGTGALVGIALGKAIPGLKVIFPDWGAGPALAAIAAGTALVGGGTYIQMLANGGGSATPSAPGSTPATGATGAGAARGTGFRGTPLGFQDAGNGGSRTTILNYNFNGPMGGSPRRIAREIRDLTTAGDTLLPGFRPVGGR
jgi:hypothetical protein